MPRGGKRPGAGRKHGSKNQSGELLRASINAFLERNIDTVDTWFQQVDDPYKKLDMLFRVAEYALPKLARQEVTGEDGGPVKHTFSWEE
jgi:hypothetical protein